MVELALLTTISCIASVLMAIPVALAALLLLGRLVPTKERNTVAAVVLTLAVLPALTVCSMSAIVFDVSLRVSLIPVEMAPVRF